MFLPLQIYETAGFGSGRLLAELYAPIPESSVTSQSVALENVEFSSYEKIQFSHDGVGSGENVVGVQSFEIPGANVPWIQNWSSQIEEHCEGGIFALCIEIEK